MIKNSRQRQVAARKLNSALESARGASSQDRSVWLALASDIESEIDEFDRVTTGQQVAFPIAGIDDLPDALVKARLAKGWTQAQLAEELDVAEQQVQRDEAGGYERAEVHRLADTADALGYELKGAFVPVGTPGLTVALPLMSATTMMSFALAGSTVQMQLPLPQGVADPILSLIRPVAVAPHVVVEGGELIEAGR